MDAETDITPPDSIPSLADLYSIPEVDSKWYEIGASLCVDLNSLLNIKEQDKSDFKKKRDMFKVFHESCPHASWRRVLNALTNTGCLEAANRICENFNWPSSIVTSVVSPNQPVLSSDVNPLSDTASLLLESLKPPMSSEEMITASASMTVDTDSYEDYHSAPSASDDFPLSSGQSLFTQTMNLSPMNIPQLVEPLKSATTNFSELSVSGKPGASHQTATKQVSGVQSTSILTNMKSFRSELTEATTKIYSKLNNDLHDAVKKGNQRHVIELIEKGADMNAILNEDNQTALMVASIEGHKDIVKYLLSKNASVSLQDINGATVTFLTASAGNYEVLKVLLTNPRVLAEINTKDKHGTPILIGPAKKGFSMVTEYLLENKVNPNDTNKGGVTALYVACQKGQKEVVKVLVDHRADVTMTCLKTSKTPLQEAIDSEYPEIVSILVKAEAKLNARSRKLFTCKTVDRVRELVAKGVNIDYRQSNGITPLIYHTEAREKEIVQELLRQKANIDIQDSSGMSALMVAAKVGDPTLVQILIGKGAILDLKEKERGHTALMIAAIGMHVRVVKELVLAKADINIKSRDGRTSLDMATTLKCTEIVDLLSPSHVHSTFSDPFVQLLSTYLSRKESTHSAAKPLQNHPRSSSGHQSLTSRTVSTVEQSSSIKDELKKCYKRIADLETRIHDLTLQGSLEELKQSDLSYLERPRLEQEYLKVKELKRKAEQYAIEAKQTAQRLSADNFKLKEDLTKERHNNELIRKNMLRERSSTTELSKVKQIEFDEAVSNKAHQLLSVKQLNSHKRPMSDEFKKCITELNVKVKLAFVGVTGLPYSGKTTLIKQILTDDDGTSPSEERANRIPGFSFFEAILRRDTMRDGHAIIASKKNDAETYGLASALVKRLMPHGIPDFSIDSESLTETVSLFGDRYIDHYFMEAFKRVCDLVLIYKDDGLLESLPNSALSFLNIYDIGMNKAVFEILSIVSSHCSNCILVNVLNLKLYGSAEALNRKPEASYSDAVKERYATRGDDNVMKIHPAVDYFLQFVKAAHGYSTETPDTLLVGTNKDNFHTEQHLKNSVKVASRVVRCRAQEMRVANSLYPSMLVINANHKDDCEKVKDAFVNVIEDKDFEVDLPLKFLFLRCFLHQTHGMFISRNDLVKIAQKVNIETDKEIDKFLDTFLSCASLFCSPCGNFPFLHDYIILDIGAFLREMDKLYYLEHYSANSPADLQLELQNVKYGFVSERLAKKIWTGPVINGMTSYRFCLKALEAMRIIVPFKTNLLPEEFLENLSMDELCYFMPSVRTDYFVTSGALDLDPKSLYVMHETDIVPFHKLAQFVVYLQERHQDSVTFIPTTCYSTVHLEWRLIATSQTRIEGSEEALQITIIFYKDVVQIKLQCPDRLIELNAEAVDYVRSILKMACVHVFHQTSSNVPGNQYRLATVCPKQSHSLSPLKPHLLPFCITESNFLSIYCDLCKAQVSDDDNFEGSVWVRADYRGPHIHAVYHNESLTSGRLMEVARHLAKEPTILLSKLALSLGQSEEKLFSTTRTSLQDIIFSLLTDWTKSNSIYSVQDLASILDECSYFEEAIRLNPKLLSRPNSIVGSTQSPR